MVLLNPKAFKIVFKTNLTPQILNINPLVEKM